MVKHLSVDDASPRVKDFVQQLGGEQKDYILEIVGQPIVGIVPPWQVEKLAQDRHDILLLLHQSWERNRTVSEEEVQQVVVEAIQEVSLRGAPATKQSRRQHKSRAEIASPCSQ